MKKKFDMPNIPKLKNAVIAMNLDLKKKKEHIIIGEFDYVNRYIHGGKKEKIIFEKLRPIGSFLLDILPQTGRFADIRVNLSDNLCKKGSPNTSWIESLYAEENPLMKFTALKLWKEYMIGMKRIERRENTDDFTDRIEEITLPFRYNLMSEVLEWQRSNPLNPLCDMPYEYFKYPLQTFLVADTVKTKEYAVSDNTILPLVVYYLKTIYENNKYFSYCKVCGKLFLAPDVNKTVICSDKCRKKQQKINKQKYDDATRDVDYERTYRNEKMYWYNRIQKAKKHNIEETALNRITKAYDEFKRVANIKKKQVKEGLLSFTAFDGWYLDKRCEIDELMESFGLGKYK